jgi:hypothetical protein
VTRRTPVDPLQLGLPIASRELSGAGIPRSRVRATDVTHPFHGVHIIGGEATGLRQRCEALMTLLPVGAAFSHTTAALLWGAPVPREDELSMHLVVPGARSRPVRPGIVGHRSRAPRVTMLGTLPVVEPAQMFVQLATMLDHDDLVAVGDYLVTPQRVARKPAIASVDDLAAAIPPGARGAARARDALRDVRIGADSPMETRLRLLLVRAGLPEPELNPELVGLHPDLLYRRDRLVIEYEGDHHRTDPRTWRHDIARRERFQAAGFRVMQVHAADLRDEPAALAARVAAAIRGPMH